MGREPRHGEVAEHLPLSPLDFSVLLVLTAGPSYGYGLMKALRDRAAGSIRLAPGNLYQILDRLEERGWVEEVPPPSASEGGRPRRWYGLTDTGRAVARAEADRLAAMVSRAQQIDLLSAREGA